MAACVSCLVATVWAQKPPDKNDSDNPSPAGSLGDLARQTRAHAAADEGKSSRAQELADEMQQEQEVADNAPVGFKNYDAGDYRLYVPYPFSLEGRENGGTVLLGSRLGITNTEVMAGTPIPVPPNLSDADLLNAVRQLASLHGTQANCSATTRGSHKAFRCSWQTSPTLLGHAVYGSMEFILASNSLIPVMCVSPDDLHQLCVIYDTYGNNTCSDRDRQLYGWDHRKAQAAADEQYREERNTVQMCDQVIYPSIQLKEDIVVHPVSIAEGKAPKPVSAVAQDMSVVAGAQGSSLADLARQSRQAAHGKALATLDNAEGKSLAPAGYQSFPMQYCQNPQQCQQASVIIPEKSEVVSTTNGQYIFKAMLNGDAVMLYAGPSDVNSPYRSLTSPDYMRMRDLANSNRWSRENADGLSPQEIRIQSRSAYDALPLPARPEEVVDRQALIEMQGGGQFWSDAHPWKNILPT
jgi:hypothetical protein